jgi:hypothetical protein
MRPVLLADLDLAARVLLALPQARRARAMDDLLAVAERADRHRMATGRLSADGDGSLLAVAITRHRSPATLAGPDYRRCLSVVLDRLARADAAIAGRDTIHHSDMGGEGDDSALL